MTRTTQSNKIIQVSPVFTIHISPLNYTRSFAFKKTLRTLARISFLSSYPLVKSSVTNFLTFPFWMSIIGKQLSQLCVDSRGITFVSFLISKRNTSRGYFSFSKSNLTLTRTTRSCTDFRWRFSSLFSTHEACDYHKAIVASI